MRILISSNERSNLEIENAEYVHLLVGDITAEGSDTVIERKTINDLATSCSSPHMWEQLKNMRANYKRSVVAIVGYLEELNYKNKLKIPHIYKSIAIMAKMGITVLWIKNDKMLSSLAVAILTDSGERDPNVPIKRVEKDKKLSVICSIPGIGQKKGMELLKTFGNINKIANASMEELKKVKGISDDLANKIHNALN